MASNSQEEPEQGFSDALVSKKSREATLRQTLSQEMKSRKAILAVTEQDDEEPKVVDLDHSKELTKEIRKELLSRAMESDDMENERFLQKVKARLDRAKVELPEVEVVFKDVRVSAKAFVATRALPSIPNYFLNLGEGILRSLWLWPRRDRHLTILNGLSGSLQPGRFTLLLGPPGCGKSTLLKLLAGKLQGSNLDISGGVTYNGYTFDEFVVQRTAAYIDQDDNHIPQLSVRETLDFAARCQGPAFNEVRELRDKEKELGIEPDWEIDAFMKASALQGKEQSIMTDYILRMLGLEVCEDTIVGDQLVRGVSGGQKKRLTTGEMIVGSKKVLFADEISTGLDSSTTYQIVKCMRNIAKLRRATILMSLLQPAPETFDLFDDVMLLAEGRIVYHGPKEQVLPFFEELGFKLPYRKGVADFLQEVTSRKDQRQFWKGRASAYRYVSVSEIAAAFQQCQLGLKNSEQLQMPFEKTTKGKDALAKTKFILSWQESFKACLRRDAALMQRNSFLYMFRIGQISFVAFLVATLFIKPRMSVTYPGGLSYLQLLFFTVYIMVVTNFSELAVSVNSLSVFWKQRDNLFFPVTCFVLPTTLLRLPYSLLNAFIYIIIVYWATGLTYSAGRFFLCLLIAYITHVVSVSQFRAISSICRTLVLSNTAAFMLVLMAFLFGGIIIPKRDVPPWWRWAVWISPMYYSQKAISINEFHAPRWNIQYVPSPGAQEQDLGRFILAGTDLDSYGLFILIGIGALVSYVIFYNIVICLAMKNLSSPEGKKAVISKDKLEEQVPDASIKSEPISQKALELEDESRRSLCQVAQENAVNGVKQPDNHGTNKEHIIEVAEGGQENETYGMSLPFIPIHLTFLDICYFVDMPEALRKAAATHQGTEQKQTGKPELQLLKNISGVFEPGVLTALMGATGAGKTTLMDCLSGRKTAGRLTGEITVNGFPQDLRTFKRVSGYCEQFDLHSPQSTVGEALWFSARLRLSPDVPAATRKAFMQEVMDLVELTVIKDSLVGKPGISGLSVEQRKRLTIAVELVANPSIIMMDEPTSGLDARAAAIVMRVVRNICTTGRTICCTIHQPSIDVFEAFDELVLLKRGGVIIYSGPLGKYSSSLIDYFQSIPGVPRISEDFNPATWMLDISTISAEQKLGLDLAEVFEESEMHKELLASVRQKAQPKEGDKPLSFPSEFPQPIWKQYLILLAKNHVLYFRNPEYTAVRIIFTVLLGLAFGTALWNRGRDTSTRQAVETIAAAQYLVVVFYGFTNAATVQPIVSYERLVFYRERFAGMYSSWPYALAQGDVEIPYLLAQSILYSIITYWLIRYDYSAAKFFWYTLFMFLTLAYYTYYGMSIVAWTETIAKATTVSVIAYAVWNLMAGFIIPKPRVPGWWIWLLYLTPTHWSFYGLVVGQLGDVETTFNSQTGGQTVVSQFIDDYFGLRHNFVGWVALILVGFVIFFRVITVFAICKFTFGKR